MFIPDTAVYNKNECSNLKFISSTGLLVSLPFDCKVGHMLFCLTLVLESGRKETISAMFRSQVPSGRNDCFFAGTRHSTLTLR